MGKGASVKEKTIGTTCCCIARSGKKRERRYGKDGGESG